MVPSGSPLCGGDVAVYVFDINQASLPTPFLFYLTTSAFSLCSFGLFSALMVLSALYLFMKVSFGPDTVLCG